MITTRKANRFEAGRQLDTLVQKLGAAEVGKRFHVSEETVNHWRSDFVPVTKCVAIGELYRDTLAKMAG